MERLVRHFHRKQFRNHKEGYLPAKIPYADHLLGVKTVLSSSLSKFGECKDKQAFQDMCDAALGHDLLEDTDATEEDVLSATNPHVLALIKELTNPVDDDHTDQYMQQLRTASEEARLIKYADLIENTASVCYCFHVVGEKWAYEFYRPILRRTRAVLEETSFPNYPETAHFMRNSLSVYADLLDVKCKVHPWQYSKKASETIIEAIPEKDLAEITEQNEYKCRRISGAFRNGLLTHDEALLQVKSVFADGFYGFLSEKRIGVRMTSDNWESFLNDYHLWKEDKLSGTNSAKPWLFYYAEKIEGGLKSGADASALDKRSFFRLMDSFMVPPEFFQPLPREFAKPDFIPMALADDLKIAGEDVWADDGGLSSEGFELGNTITLTDHYGLKSVIKITEHLIGGDSARREADYIGDGYIEGYTEKKPHRIKIRLWKGQIFSLYTIADKEDMSEFQSFPLWKAWRENNDRTDAILTEAIEMLLERLAQEQDR